MDSRKENLIRTLRAFMRQRPGLGAYRSEMRSISKSLQHAELMLANIARRDSITADSIINAAKHAFSGRLSIVESADKPGRIAIDYCTGQYWPTEYRNAVCAVLSSVLWDYWRTNGASTGDAIRKMARDEFGRTIASTWFR